MVVRLIAVVGTGWLVAALPGRETGGPTVPGSAPSDPATALAALVGDTATGMLLVMGAWLLLAGLAGAASSIPGPAGRAAGRAWAWLVPRAARAALAAAVGVGTTAGPVAATGTMASATTVAATAAAAPAQPAVSGRLMASGANTVPQVARPSTHGRWSGAPATPTPTIPRTDITPADRVETTVTVRPGDSLWAIAARRLGPGSTDAEVAAEWPRWYAHNRTSIGPDPDLLVTGTVLTVPPSSGATR